MVSFFFDVTNKLYLTKHLLLFRYIQNRDIWKRITQKNDWNNYYLDLSDELAIKIDQNRKWFDMKWFWSILQDRHTKPFSLAFNELCTAVMDSKSQQKSIGNFRKSESDEFSSELSIWLPFSEQRRRQQGRGLKLRNCFLKLIIERKTLQFGCKSWLCIQLKTNKSKEYGKLRNAYRIVSFKPVYM